MMRRSRYNPPDYMLLLTDANEVIVIYKDGTKKFMLTLPSTPRDIAVRNDGAFCYIGVDEKLRVYDNTGTLKKTLDSTTTPAIFTSNGGCAFAGTKIYVVEKRTTGGTTLKMRRYSFADLVNPTQDWECTASALSTQYFTSEALDPYYPHYVWLTPDGSEALWVITTTTSPYLYLYIFKVSNTGVATLLYSDTGSGRMAPTLIEATIDNLLIAFCARSKLTILKNDGTKAEYGTYDIYDTATINFDGSVVVANHDSTVDVWKSTNPPSLVYVLDESVAISGTSIPIQLTDDGKYLFIVDVTTIKVRDIDAKAQKYTYGTIYTKQHQVLREYSV